MSSPDIGFCLTTGGPFHRLLVALGAERPSPWLILTVGGLFGAAAWLPLFAASAMDGHAFGWPGAFIQDIGVHARLLLALPLLLWAERPLTHRLDRAVAHLAEAGLVDESNRDGVLAAVRWAERLRDQRGFDLAIALVALGLSSADLVERTHGLR